MTGLRKARRPAAPVSTRKPRVAGIAVRTRKPVVAPAVDEVDAAEPPPSTAAATEPPAARWRVPAAVLVAVTILAAAVAVWSTVEARETRTGGAAANAALADSATTQAVTTTVRRAVESVFSYDYSNTDRTREAAREVLVGRAVQQYEDLYSQVEQQAQARRLVLTTAVRSIGVTELRGDRAVVLVFVDQQIVQTGDGAHTSGASQLSVTVVQSSGSWLIEDITVL